MTQLATNRFELAMNGIRYNVHRATPEIGTPIEAVMSPAYWAHVSAKMAAWDEIRVIAEDGSYFLELLVRDVGHLYAKVALKASPIEFDKEVVEVPQGYEIKWRGPVSKFGVVRGTDVLKDKFVDKGEARAWLDELLKKVA